MSVPIPPIGIHKIADEQYFAIDCPSSSQTKVLLDGTNAHLAHQRENPREETDAFALGAYVHALLLDPSTVDSAFVRIGRIDRRTKDGKAEYESATKRAALSGARLVTDEQVAQAEAMAASVRANPSASTLLDAVTHREATIIGAIGGRPAKCKADAVVAHPDGHILIDLKTAASAKPSLFAADAAKYGYYHQFAFYRRLLEQQPSLGKQDDSIIVVVEKEPPHLCAVYRVPEIAIEIADRRIDDTVERWWAVHGGDRMGYPQNIVNLDPPRWWVSAD